MRTNKKISEILSKQISWLQTWKTKYGAYNGYVVHRHDLKRMFRIHDTPWSQSSIINGYLNLYQRTKDEKWLDEAIQAADLQCSRFHKSGKYIYAGFEDDRFSSLVHNSLANCALLDLASALIKDNKYKKAQNYLDVAKDNIDKYIIGKLWNEEFGAFKFSEIDYYSPPNLVRFVTNMNSLAVESIVKLSNLVNDKGYQDYVLRIGEWLLTEQIESQGLESGGINYSQVQPRVLISIYTALAMRGIDDLYQLTQDKRYLQMIKNAARHLMVLIDPETNLFYHSICQGRLFRYPQFIAGAGIILKALDDARILTGEYFNYEESLNAILEKQLANGSFPNFVGYNTPENCRLNGIKEKVWEDMVPVMGWNAHIFEFLTRTVEKH
ncbi:MAG: hypothetical protein GYA34_17040, partial [Chloroflexi bacterium]|nr:hypothetical protein [Chloroflexota bacterium]